VSRLGALLYRHPSAARVLHAIRLVQGRAVSPTAPFAVGALLGRPKVGTYTSRRTGQTVFIRHREDLHVTRELVGHDIYSPPPEVAAALRESTHLTVLDLGANIGLFTLNVLYEYGESIRVIAVEPDPGNLELLHLNVAANGCSNDVEVVEAAVGTADGTAVLTAGLGGLSHLSGLARDEKRTRHRQAMEVRVVDFFQLAPRPDLVKMDIEGGEWSILRDPRLRELESVALVFEWHVEGSGVSHPAAEAERLVHSAGFDRIRHLSPAGVELAACPPAGETVGLLWAWRNPPRTRSASRPS
jgi:FkbM family methyltransferase